MDEGKRWVTMSDVAQQAGVSTITVSRVLRMPDRVSSKTREAVTQAIDVLGYVPNEGAGALSSSRTRVVGAIISTLGGSAFTSTINGLATSLRRAGFHLLMASTDYSQAKEEDYIAAMLARRPDGLVLSATEHTEKSAKLLARAGIPVVEIWELPGSSPHHNVGFSNEKAAHEMVRDLLRSGRGRIGVLGNAFGSDRRVRERVRGYERALLEDGIGEPRIITLSDRTMTSAERGAREFATLLQQWPDTDAVFCVNDTIALGALCEARRRKIDVPGSLAIAGFGDFDFANDYGLGLTTVHFPGYRIGELAAEVVVEELCNPSRQPRVIDVGFEVVRRRTA